MSISRRSQNRWMRSMEAASHQRRAVTWKPVQCSRRPKSSMNSRRSRRLARIQAVRPAVPACVTPGAILPAPAVPAVVQEIARAAVPAPAQAAARRPVREAVPAAVIRPAPAPAREAVHRPVRERVPAGVLVRAAAPAAEAVADVMIRAVLRAVMAVFIPAHLSAVEPAMDGAAENVP